MTHSIRLTGPSTKIGIRMSRLLAKAKPQLPERDPGNVSNLRQGLIGRLGVATSGRDPATSYKPLQPLAPAPRLPPDRPDRQHGRANRSTRGRAAPSQQSVVALARLQKITTHEAVSAHSLEPMGRGMACAARDQTAERSRHRSGFRLAVQIAGGLVASCTSHATSHRIQAMC